MEIKSKEFQSPSSRGRSCDGWEVFVEAGTTQPMFQSPSSRGRSCDCDPGLRQDDGVRVQVSIPFISGKVLRRRANDCSPRGCPWFQSPSSRGRSCDAAFWGKDTPNGVSVSIPFISGKVLRPWQSFAGGETMLMSFNPLHLGEGPATCDEPVTGSDPRD